MVIKIPAAGVRLVEAQTSEISQFVNLVMGALRTQKSLDAYPEAIYPDRVVVRQGDGRLMAWPFQVDADNRVTFGTPFEAVTQHVPAQTRVSEARTEGVFVEAVGEASAGRYRIRIIEAGLSGNGNLYPDAVLREAVPLFEGVRVFSKTDEEHTSFKGKSFDNLIGSISEVAFVEASGGRPAALEGTLTLLEPEGAVGQKIRAAWDRGMTKLFGFSIDAHAKSTRRVVEGKRVQAATRFTKINSVDLIVEPGAGGELIRLIEAVDPQKESDDMLRKKLLDRIAAMAPKVFASIDADKITDEELEVKLTEAIAEKSEADKAAAAVDAAKSAAAGAKPNDGETRLTESVANVQIALAQMAATTAINASTLPQPAKDKLLQRFAEAKAPFGMDTVKAEIEAERAYLARFTESGKVAVPFDQISVEDAAVKMEDMLSAFFDPTHKNHRDVRSFKEAYIEFTGDRLVTGRLQGSTVRFAEALISSSWVNALNNTITKRMQQVVEQATDLAAWRKVCNVTSVGDFRTQERFRVGGYGNLPAVAEAGPYNALSSPSDAKATYAVSKRGGTETITLEMVKNDDVRAISRIPTELALAAANTRYEFVFDFFRTNPTIYDTVALYHASHANLFTAALDATSFAAHRLAMLKQTRAGSSKRLGVGPAAVLVPFDLQETAFNLFVRNQNLDKTFVQSINPEVIPVAYWTDTNDWCSLADPNRFPVLEIAFLDGQEEPETFVQDMPNVGSMFSNDQITMKIRHIYGGAIVVDGEKGTTKAVVP